MNPRCKRTGFAVVDIAGLLDNTRLVQHGRKSVDLSSGSAAVSVESNSRAEVGENPCFHGTAGMTTREIAPTDVFPEILQDLDHRQESVDSFGDHAR